MRYSRVLICAAFAVLLMHTHSNAQAQSRDQKRWPSPGGGWSTSFTRYNQADDRVYVDLSGIVNYQISMYRYYPRQVVLNVSWEQANEVKSFYDEMKARRMPYLEAEYQAELTGDPIAIGRAKRATAEAAMPDRLTHDVRYKRMIVDVLNQNQLDDVHALCVNVAMERIGLVNIITKYTSDLVESGLTQKELADIRRAMDKAEMEMLRELVEMRRKAWKTVMDELPPSVVQKIEKDLGFDGLDKSSN